jgi:hypothetical protein
MTYPKKYSDSDNKLVGISDLTILFAFQICIIAETLGIDLRIMCIEPIF